MEQFTVVLVVLAATWGGMFNVMKIVEMKNGIRDRVLDMHDGKVLDKEQKQLLLSHDYVPMCFGIWLFLLVFAIGLASIPLAFWAKAPDKLSSAEAVVCFGAAGFTVFAMLVDVVASRSEYRKMRAHINSLP